MTATAPVLWHVMHVPCDGFQEGVGLYGDWCQEALAGEPVEGTGDGEDGGEGGDPPDTCGRARSTDGGQELVEVRCKK